MLRTFFAPDISNSSDLRLLTVYEGEWRANKEHGVGSLHIYDEGNGAAPSRPPEVKQGMWKSGTFEREHKGFKQAGSLFSDISTPKMLYTEKMASDLGASLPQQRELGRSIAFRAAYKNREKAPDDYVKQVLRSQGTNIGRNNSSLPCGRDSFPSIANVSMSTLTDRAALMKAMNSAVQVKSAVDTEKGASDTRVLPDRHQQVLLMKDEMLRARGSYIYPRSFTSPDAESRRRRPGTHESGGAVQSGRWR